MTSIQEQKELVLATSMFRWLTRREERLGVRQRLGVRFM